MSTPAFDIVCLGRNGLDLYSNDIGAAFPDIKTFSAYVGGSPSNIAVVQASWFAQNFSENFMLDGVLAGELVVPAGTSREPFIDIDDIADVAVAAFLEPGLQNRLFEVTGPRAMSFAECVDEISAATGYRVRLVELPLKDYIEVLKDQDVPDYLVELLRELFTDLFDGRNAYTAEGVREALGRPATDFSAYALKTAATGVWRRDTEGRVA